MFLPRIYPITDTRLSKLSHAEQVEKLIGGGARFIQLREKYGAARDFFDDAAKAVEIARKHGVKIIINDRVDIALALGADGVHLGQDDLPPAEARKILGAPAIIGFSTHNLQQAVEAVKLPVDYIAAGPVFPTRTKENPESVVGLETIKNIRKEIGVFPLVAIGGITSANFFDVLKLGADSVAVIGDLLSAPDKISEKFKEFSLNQIDK
ncbi:MAG TPA: thiamine phosphate synthase [Pyrinomonadaceae bacterium]|nr:thiamine phosphate synthase [Pyrinomonadaceae bacterium]